MSEREIAWYFEAYCEHLIVFHAAAYSAANHQDRLRGEPLRTSSVEIIGHKIEAIRLLNTLLSDLDNANIETVLMAMLCLMRKEPQEDQLQPDQMLLFRPHLPQVNGVDIYGRGMDSRPDGIHRHAIGYLITRAGGLGNLRSSGLAKAIAG